MPAWRPALRPRHNPRRVPLSTTDLLTFVLFLGAVIFVSLRAARGRGTAEGYFLAGRNLGGWAIGMSLVATNISTEHFVGMSGSAATDIGLAIASYEWTAAAALIVIGWFLLPRYLKSGVFTMPEFLERRYDRGARTILAALLTAATVFVAMATVLYAGAVALNAIFLLPELLAGAFGLAPDAAELAATLLGVWGIGLLASVYTIYGGLRAVVWSDFIQGIAILAGGALVLWLGFAALGGDGGVLAGAARFLAENRDRLHTVLPADHPEVPWTAVFIGGLWIAQFFYWGVNQFITQRTLAARSLAEGQRGIIIAAWLKILVPFLICFPGILAVQLYGDQIAHPDQAYPVLVRELLPPALRGVLLAALAGAIMSSFNSMLNSASTMYALDVHPRLFGRRDAPRQRIPETPDGASSVRVAKVASTALRDRRLPLGAVDRRLPRGLPLHPDGLGFRDPGHRRGVLRRGDLDARPGLRRPRRPAGGHPDLRRAAARLAGDRVPPPHGDQLPDPGRRARARGLAPAPDRDRAAPGAAHRGGSGAAPRGLLEGRPRPCHHRRDLPRVPLIQGTSRLDRRPCPIGAPASTPASRGSAKPARMALHSREHSAVRHIVSA